MYSLAKIHSTALGLRLPGNPVAVDWQRGADWIDAIRGECGTIYAFQFDGQQVEGDTLLKV